MIDFRSSQGPNQQTGLASHRVEIAETLTTRWVMRRCCENCLSVNITVREGVAHCGQCKRRIVGTNEEAS